LARQEDRYQWITKRLGTLHSFQGREAEAVILILGAPLFEQQGSQNWAGRTPNLLNVAATRAKEAFYIIGNHSHWQKTFIFKKLDKIMPV